MASSKISVRFSFLRFLFAALAMLLAVAGRAQSFTTDRIDYGDGSSNVFSSVTIGPDGKYYAFWKDGNFVQSASQTEPRFQLLRYESSTSSWTVLSTIMATAIPGLVANAPSNPVSMLGDRVSLRVDSQGRYHALVHGYLTSGSTIVYLYSANGTTWSYTNIESNNNTTNYTINDAALALDSNDRPHVALRVSEAWQAANVRPTRIRYHYFNGTSWSGGETAQEAIGSSYAINTFVFSIDRAGKAHIAFAGELNGSGTDACLRYVTNASGSWSAPVTIAAGATSSAAVINLSIKTDSTNKVHIVRRDQAYNLFYDTNKSGSWVSTQINGSLKGLIDLDALAINGGNDLVFFYNTQSSDVAGSNIGETRFAYLPTGQSTWQTGAVYTGLGQNTGRYTTAAFKDSREAMFLFDDYTYTGGSPAYTARPRQLQFAVGQVGTPPPAIATVTSPTSANVAGTTATLGGNVTADGGATVTARGVVFAPTSTNSNPQLGGNGVTTAAGSGTTGVFTVNVTGLSLGTGYSFKAYATNSAGTAYSSVGTFTTLSDVTPPTVASVVRLTPSAQTTAQSTVIFRVTYSEDVYGVSVGGFVVEPVNGSNVVGSVTGVTGSGATRDVTVGVTSGTGEFRLKVIN